VVLHLHHLLDAVDRFLWVDRIRHIVFVGVRVSRGGLIHWDLQLLMWVGDRLMVCIQDLGGGLVEMLQVILAFLVVMVQWGLVVGLGVLCIVR